MWRQQPAKFGAGIGVFDARFLLTMMLLAIVPQELLSSAASSAYIATWSQPIVAVGGFAPSVGIPLACAPIAYRLTMTAHTPGSVVVGYLVGGAVFIVGNAMFVWRCRTSSRQMPAWSNRFSAT